MHNQTQSDYKTISDLPSSFTFIQDSQDIYACLESIGKLPKVGPLPGCLFAEIANGDYGQVYSCDYYVPVLTHEIERIQ